jgi:hypothetical protein
MQAAIDLFSELQGTVLDAPSNPSTLEADTHRAEGLLFDLATELRRITVEKRTCALHLRALALKAAVMRWPESRPDQAERDALCDEALSLLQETRAWRGRLRSGTHWAYRERPRDPGAR